MVTKLKVQAIVLACLSSLAASTFAASDPVVTDIVTKNVAARGGLQAWRNVTTMTMSGEMDGGGKKDTKLPFVLNMKRPHKSRLEIKFQGQDAVQVYDGKQGWKVRPYL